MIFPRLLRLPATLWHRQASQSAEVVEGSNEPALGGLSEWTLLVSFRTYKPRPDDLGPRAAPSGVFRVPGSALADPGTCVTGMDLAGQLSNLECRVEDLGPRAGHFRGLPRVRNPR